MLGWEAVEVGLRQLPPALFSVSAVLGLSVGSS